MRRFLMILWLAMAAPAVWAQWPNPSSETPRDGVTASGEAEVRVVPDLVEIALGVETRNADLGKARQLNDESVDAVIAAAKRHGIDAAHIKTDYVSIEPNFYSSAQLYEVRKSIVITAADVASFDSLLADLVRAGANHVHNVRFMTSELRKHRDEARVLACTAAREKAELLAKSLGRTVGGARAISEGTTNDWWSSYRWWWGWNGSQNQNVSQNAAVSSFGPSPSGVAPGQISVSARVTVTFDLR